MKAISQSGLILKFILLLLIIGDTTFVYSQKNHQNSKPKTRQPSKVQTTANNAFVKSQQPVKAKNVSKVAPLGAACCKASFSRAKIMSVKTNNKINPSSK